MTATLRLREAAPDSSRLDFADLLLSMAELYLATDRPREAESVAERAHELLAGKVLPTHLTLAQHHAVLAESLSRRGDHNEAITHLRQAEEIRLQVHPPDHPRLAELYTSAAAVYSAAGDAEAAQRYHSQAVRIRCSLGVGGPSASR